MPITDNDLQFLRPVSLSDDDNGGGAATNNVIVPGQENNLFDDIAMLDRVNGDVSLRKCFAAVRTSTTDKFSKPIVMVDTPPDDPNVSVTLFSTGDWFDLRSDARDVVERYLARSVPWPGLLLENQLAGQRTIAIQQREEEALPKIGQVFALVYNEGLPNELEQYVRITRTSDVVRTFTIPGDGNNDKTFKRRIVTCELSDPLKATFPGDGPTPYSTTTKTRIRETVVANAARYYGASRLTLAATTGQFRVKASSIYGQLVPSAQVETALTNLQAGGSTAAVVDSSDNTFVQVISAPIGPNQVLVLGVLVPGSVSIAFGVQTMTDSGGALSLNGTEVASVDYTNGQISFNANAPTWVGSKTITARLGTLFPRVSNTASHDVTIETRSLLFAKTLVPIPAPGTLVFSYRVNDKWIDLRDNGLGELKNGTDSSLGVGRIDFVSGALTVTMGALPDVSTSLLMAWGSNVTSFNRAGLAGIKGYVKLQLPLVDGKRAEPTKVGITWANPAGGNFSVTDNGKGALTGAGTGTVNYVTGEVVLKPNTIPSAATGYTLGTDIFSPPDGIVETNPVSTVDGTDLVYDTDAFQTGAPRDIIPGTFSCAARITWETESNGLNDASGARVVLTDDSDGKVMYEAVQVGTINYTTGIVRLNQTWGIERSTNDNEATNTNGAYRAFQKSRSYSTGGVSLAQCESMTIFVYGATNTPEGSNTTTQVGANGGVDLPLRAGERIVPGGVRFTMAGKTYTDISGSVYTDVDPLTGAGTLVGGIDYGTGKILLSTLPAGSSTVTVQSLLTEAGGQLAGGIEFRIPVAPVRPASFNLVYPKPDGSGTLSVNAAADGSISALGVKGKIDVANGIVRITFGKLVTRTPAIEAKPWYDASSNVGGDTWQPELIDPSVIRYNAIAFTYLPLSADLLGLDPVRLPSDGRVPIFRTGDVVSVHHTDESMFFAPTIGATMNVGRVRLAELRLIDSDGVYLPSSMYTTDLDAGTVTLGASFSLTGYTAPIYAEHRIEDIALCNDTQINGDITLLRALTHDYPIGSIVSGCMETGDLQGRVAPPFSQQTWTGVWSDALIGSGTSAQFQFSNYPITVNNLGAIEEKWRIQFTSSIDFVLVGQHVGQIASGNTSTTFSPNNPTTGHPYFTIPAQGWGSGWSVGNVLRFNTKAASYPVWLARSVGMGPATVNQDQFRLRLIGSVDA